MFGPPGAGKGTQSERIVKDYKMFKLSTGDLLRAEIKRQSELGKKIEKIVNFAYKQTIKIVEQNIQPLTEIANNLMKDAVVNKTKLDDEEIYYI